VSGSTQEWTKRRELLLEERHHPRAFPLTRRHRFRRPLLIEPLLLMLAVVKKTLERGYNDSFVHLELPLVLECCSQVLSSHAQNCQSISLSSRL
jgi:hypothetical protein